ncbi:MAG: ABC transporter permease [Planctomycetota bacterium]
MSGRSDSPTAIALRRFLRRPVARIGLALLTFFALIAIYAPLLASPVAILWWDAEGLRLPLLADLFNRNQYGAIHHLLFNVLIPVLPLMLLLVWWGGRRGWGGGRRLLVGTGVVLVAMGLCLIPLLPQGGELRPLWTQRPPTVETWQHYRHEQEAGNDVWALFPLVPHGFRDKYEVYQAPGVISVETGARFWLGTDDRGASVLARMLYGARVSLTIGIIAVGISMFIGVVIGAASGFFGGWTDLLLQRAVEIMMSFPTFILVLLAVAVLGRDIYLMIVIFGLTGWAGIARLVRGEFLREMGREYVLAAQTLGLPRWRIMFRHILPNVATPLLISATFGIAGMVLAESSLAFLGLGDDSVPSWGALLNVGRQQVQYSWLIWVPGLAIFALVSALNLVGNGLREALGPKGQRR